MGRWSTGKRRGISQTGRQSITGQHRYTQDKQPCTHLFTPKGNLERPVNPNTHASSLWEKARVPRENPNMLKENPGRKSESGSSRCKEKVLPTSPPCSHYIILYIKKLLHRIRNFPMCMRGFSLGTPVSSHSRKTLKINWSLW
ncbi:hypothetical protein AMECASPLE_010061 [Ameca splendens]|uniref:Uncharacterized protein n=1 Tax=Ameca splendens TaxID=208324 RepID=A0ABV0ZA71_9TELE